MKTYKYDSRVAAIHSLRINYKSLAAEAAINRREMRKAGPLYRSDIALHRRTYVRQEARYTNLALAFLRGRTYKAVENNTKQWLDVKRLSQKVMRHWWQPACWKGLRREGEVNAYASNADKQALAIIQAWVSVA